MQLKFTKMHGLGNDFVVIDAINQQISLTNSQIREIADRKFGVGCDQLLLVERPRSPGVDFRYRIFNADGSEVEQCGNGARCFARFVKEKGLTEKREIPVETKNGNIILSLKGDDDVTVNMGAPNLSPESLPFTAEHEQVTYPIEVEGETIEISAVSMGNPHAITVVSETSSAPVCWMGPKIERHELFPNRVNAGFMQVVDRENINLRVYERGCGETLACGTGACAAVVAGITRGMLDSTVNVSLPGGKLVISWEGGDSPVMMTGPATVVFEGVMEK
ncbi:MAG: diaminopimelate epimerase [Gammaproteobacteria bacterium]|nr:MAG: diaminopimelate epimerase [Gammaproteobacteria bacterium]